MKSNFKNPLNWLRHLSILDRSPTVALLAGVWVAAGATTAAGFYLYAIAQKEKAQATATTDVFEAFATVRFVSKPLTEEHYKEQAASLNARLEGVEVRAEKSSLVLEVKAVQDYEAFEQALQQLAALPGGKRYEATELCSGVGKCGAVAYRAVLKGTEWSVQ